MKKIILVAAIIAASTSAPSFAADQVIWSCNIVGADTYFKLVRGDDDNAIVTPFGERLPAVVYHEKLDLRWVHRDGETTFVVVIEPTFNAGFYDFTDVDQGESTFPEYRMKCKKEVDFKANLPTKRQQSKEAELRAMLQVEENQRRLNSLREAYILAIRQKVERNWRKPPGSRKMPECWVRVTQGAGGIILDVTFGTCGDSTGTYRASIENAVYKAEPLPKPGDPALFERELTFLFNPEQ